MPESASSTHEEIDFAQGRGGLRDEGASGLGGLWPPAIGIPPFPTFRDYAILHIRSFKPSTALVFGEPPAHDRTRSGGVCNTHFA